MSTVQGWGTKPPPRVVLGTSLQSTDCCSALLAALHQWRTVRKKQRYAFLIHFLPGIRKMCCFVGNLLGLFLIAVWDVRKHWGFEPCTVAEFTFPRGWREGFLWPARCSPAPAFTCGPLPSPPRRQLERPWLFRAIGALFAETSTPDQALQSNCRFWQA